MALAAQGWRADTYVRRTKKSQSREDIVIKTLKMAAIAAAAVTLTSSVAMAQANLIFHTAGSGTPVALTATALVEYAAERGIANIQVSEGKVATN